MFQSLKRKKVTELVQQNKMAGKIKTSGQIKVQRGFVDIGNEAPTKRLLVKRKKKLKQELKRAMPLP